MLAVLGLLLLVASAVPLAMWRFDQLGGGEAWPLVVALGLAGFACLAVYDRSDD